MITNRKLEQLLEEWKAQIHRKATERMSRKLRNVIIIAGCFLAVLAVLTTIWSGIGQ